MNSPSSSDGFSDIFKSDSEFNIINPDDFLNESFFSEFKTESENNNKRKYSESSQKSSSSTSSFENVSVSCTQPMQLTPPISPNPIIIDNAALYQSIRVVPFISSQVEKKIKTLVPKPSLSSSDSETTQNYMANININNNNNALECPKSNSPTDKALIKRNRLIRNRESALESRRKKKEYLQNLEVEVTHLRKENHFLKEENSILQAKLKHYSSFTCRCVTTLSSKLSTKNASLLFALVFMVGFNIIPITNMLTATNSIKKSISKPNVEFQSRHLLFSNNTTGDSNLTAADYAELDQDSQVPLYFNQTNLIRKSNIENIRRWIHMPEFINATLNDFNFADSENKLAKMHEKSQLTTKHVKMKKKLPKKKKSIENKKNNIPLQLDADFFKLHEFFDQINRKEDTFYLFSFKADHLLLPAIDYPQNFSQIIKMNLIMPRNNGEL